MEISAIDLLKDLIAIQSFSREEDEITGFVYDYLTNHGVKDHKRYGNTVVWQSEMRSDRKTIAFAGHLDTVGYDETMWRKTHPLMPLVEGDLLYGRGSCDMKAGVAVLMKLLIEQNYGDKYNSVFIFYDREELGVPNGITDLLKEKRLPEIDFVIIPEPTELRVNYGVFGSADIILHAYGVAAHTSRAETGVNAIYELCKAIEQVRRMPMRRVEDKEEKLSVNIISGGGKDNNVVPHKAEALVDFRFDPSLTYEKVKARFDGIKGEYYEAELTYFMNGAIHDIDNEYVRKLISMSRGSFVDIYWSDIAQFGAAGITAVNFGPGSIEQAHKVDEFVDIRQIEEAHRVMKEFLGE